MAQKPTRAITLNSEFLGMDERCGILGKERNKAWAVKEQVNNVFRPRRISSQP
jgi:hypothetical protein